MLNMSHRTGLSEILASASPYIDIDDASQPGSMQLDSTKVLVVGAGGLGCEILKCLVMMGFRNICVVDMDTIDVSNLNRQFLFKDSDVGRYKAEVAAEYINTRFGHLSVHVEYKSCRIEELGNAFFSQFFLVLGGLDSISARRWLNGTIFNLVSRSAVTNEIDVSSIRFFIDGGSEGFKGQARVIVPYMTACFECTIDTFPPTTQYPLCTIAETPRLPEHCIEYSITVEWERNFAYGKKFDADNSEHLDWAFQHASARAEKFKIQGVTRQLTESVTKHIVPAVASTNALIAALMVNEAFKLVTCTNPVMDNYLMYIGTVGINAETISYERNPECLVCGDSSVCKPLTVPSSTTLQELLDILTGTFRLDKPSVTADGQPLYMQSPESLRVVLAMNLNRRLLDLVADSDTSCVIAVTDPSLAGRHFLVQVYFT